MTFKRGIYNLLDRPACRPILAVARSAVLATRHDWTRVGYDQQTRGWVHNSRSGLLVLPEPLGEGVQDAERTTRDLFLRDYRPAPGDVILDIGAGVGTETLSLAKMVGPSGLVVAVEAHPATFAMLQRMCELNELNQVHLVQAAVMDTDDAVTISDLGPSSSQMNKVGDNGISVPGVTIDRLVEKLKLDRIDFLKMNIEGAEAAAVRGATASLGLIRQATIGCHDFLADRSGDEWYRTKEDIRALLQDAGFLVTGRDDDPRPFARDYLYAVRRP